MSSLLEDEFIAIVHYWNERSPSKSIWGGGSRWADWPPLHPSSPGPPAHEIDEAPVGCALGAAVRPELRVAGHAFR